MAFLGSIGKALGLGSTASLAPSLFSGGLSLIGGVLSNASSAKSAQQQMNFQADQSATSYQRAVADMRAAGLNPMLAYSQGGASSPSGASFNASDVLTPAVNSAQGTSRLQEELKNLRETNETIKSQADLNRANSAKALAETALISANTSKADLYSQGYDAVSDAVNSIIDSVPSVKAYGSKAVNSARQALDAATQRASDAVDSIKTEYRKGRSNNNTNRGVDVYPRGKLLLPPPANYK